MHKHLIRSMGPVKWENRFGHLFNAPTTITAVIYLLSGSPACVMDGILITIGIFSPEVNQAKMVVHNKSLKQNSITFLLEDTRPMGNKIIVFIK